MKVGPNLLDRLGVLRILDPHDLVIAWVVILRKLEIVLPEEVIGNQAIGRAQDSRELL